MSDQRVRTATVECRADEVQQIRLYLPRNYSVPFGTRHDPENSSRSSRVTAYVVGTDEAGWTLDDYVIPRLASGGWRAVEVIE